MMKIEYQNLKSADIPAAAQLCADVFDGPFSWFQFPEKKKSENSFEVALTERFEKLHLSGLKHAMIVAKSDAKVVGFVEVGMLPIPEGAVVPRTEITLDSTKSDAAYLGNLAVLANFRRQSVGKSLVRIGMKVAEKWGDDDIFAAVDANNYSAISFYTKLGFNIKLDERDLIFKARSKGPRIFFSKPTTSISTQE